MLELMARGGMRVGEVLKLAPNDILDRKLILIDTKSGREQELIFIPLCIRIIRVNPAIRIHPLESR
jgi:integrase